MNIEFARKRYGTAMYTWATVVMDDGTRVNLGDQWPANTWPAAVLDPLTQHGRAVAAQRAHLERKAKS